ncbi:MAG: RidA family protein [Myxococcaceae bacterium]|nr:RidA family protein [Myxococcaceae bacterium]
MNPTLRLLNPLGLYDPTPNGYSHVAVLDGPGRLVFVAGQGGEDVSGALAADFAGQVRRAIENLRTALAGAGACLADVAKLTLLVVDHDAAKQATLAAELARAWLGAAPPACTLIPVARLALDGMLIEVDATAAPAGAPRP